MFWEHCTIFQLSSTLILLFLCYFLLHSTIKFMQLHLTFQYRLSLLLFNKMLVSSTPLFQKSLPSSIFLVHLLIPLSCYIFVQPLLRQSSSFLLIYVLFLPVQYSVLEIKFDVISTVKTSLLFYPSSFRRTDMTLWPPMPMHCLFKEHDL